MNIVELVENIVEFIQSTGVWGIIVSCGLMSIESIFPMIPLVALITINMLLMGKVVGFFVSWIFTCIGCIMSYYIFKKGFGNKFDNLTENKELLNKYKKVLRNISTGKLLLIIAMPFTPAFVVNIVAGLVKMDFKKYFIALVIGKLSMVYFLGFMGTSLLESIKNPIIIVKMIVVMLITYLIYMIIKKALKLD